MSCDPVEGIPKDTAMRRMIASLLTIVVTTWVVLALALYIFQPHFVYFPYKGLEATPADVGLPFESVAMNAGDGVRLHGWFLPAAEARGAVLYLHGNGGNISHRLLPLEVLNALGLAVLILDYRGYGESQGRPSESGTYLDAEAGWRYLTTERRIDAGAVVLYGESLGGAVATWLATRVRPAALILESAFTSVRDMASTHYPIFPAGLMLRIHYPTLERIPKVACPVLVIHSPEDEIVPFEQGQRLFRAAATEKQFLKRSGGHNDAFIVGGEQLRAGLNRFLSKVLRDARGADPHPIGP
jgi:fermentation-respiration switch protein FrsA (DUF1100 family)